MKIYYLANIRIPTEKAHGVQIMKMCEAFAAAGAEVELILSRRLNRRKEDPFDFYGVKRNFKIKKIPCLSLIRWDAYLGNLSFWIQSFSFLLIARIYLIFRPSGVIYTREDFSGLIFKNFILEVHSLPAKIKTWQKKVWQRAGVLFVLTSFIKEEMVKQGIAAAKISISPDAVDLEKFDIKISKEEARRKLDLWGDKILIGYVGMLRTMGMEKGIDTAIESLKFLDKNAFLVLVGGYDEDIAFYKNLADNFGLSNRILFVGRVEHQLVPLYLKSFDVLIAPFPDSEHYRLYMSPLKLFEYMASRRPIVVSDLPSIREVLNENNAVLVAPGSPEGLAAGIKRLLADLNFGDKIAQRAFLEIKQKYTWGQRVRNIINFIKLSHAKR